jgi:flagellar biosynthesis protein FlhF
MQIKEYEAFTLKECLQQVRSDLGPEAVILETRKFRKGGLLGWGARDAVCIVAATGITVQNDLPETRSGRAAAAQGMSAPSTSRSVVSAPPSASSSAHAARAASTPQPAASPAATPAQKAAVAAARAAFSHAAPRSTASAISAQANPPASRERRTETAAVASPSPGTEHTTGKARAVAPTLEAPSRSHANGNNVKNGGDAEHLVRLEHTMHEIKESLAALQREQREVQEKTVTAVVSAVAPAVSTEGRAGIEAPEVPLIRFPELRERLLMAGMGEALAAELLDSLPDFDAWSPQAQTPLAEAAVRDLIAHRTACAGPIVLTPGQLKAVALIGPTGVGKTTTIAKLAAHFALVEHKRVALLTVDTYRIAAVEQLKTYSQIIDIPIGVAYSQAEVLPAVEQFADYDLLLIDTAGRSQKNVMQVGELKTLLEAVHCETHLVLSAPIKEQDMLDAARRFSAARVDRILFSKLDETSTYGSLFTVADRTGIPLSYLTTGQKVPEDIEVAEGSKLAGLIVGDGVRA